MAEPLPSPFAASRISYNKYWNVPVDDLEEEENRTSLMRQQQSTFLSKVVAIGIITAMMGAVVAAIVVYEQNHVTQFAPSSLHPSLYPTAAPIVYQSCYNNMTCPVQPSTQPLYDADTGFTNYTGWNMGTGDESCCNICLESSSPPNTASSNQQLQYENDIAHPLLLPSVLRLPSGLDYDYLILDSIWLPTW